MKIYAYIALALALIGLAWYEIGVHKKAARVDEAEAALADAQAQFASDLSQVAKNIAADAQWRTDFASRMNGIDAAIAGIKIPPAAKLLQSTEVPGEPCPRVSAGPEFVRVFNEATTAAGSASPETH